MYRFSFYFAALALICLGALGGLAQEKPKVDDGPLNYQAIRMKLVFRSKVRESDAEISAKIAAEIKKRTVDFMIVPEQEKALVVIGATTDLILAIKKGLPEAKRKDITLSKKQLKFTCGLRKTTTEKPFPN